MKLTFSPFVFFMAAILFFSCQQSKKSDHALFYFPFEELLEQAAIYEYYSPDDSLMEPYFVKYQTIEENGMYFLLAAQYSSYFDLQQLTKEAILSDGMSMTENTLFLKDTSGNIYKTEVTVEYPNTYSFKPLSKDEILLYKIKWMHPQDSLKHTILTKNKKFVKDTSFIFKGEKTDAVLFENIELLEDYDEGYFEHEYTSIEIFGEQIGLLYVSKKISEGFNFHYELKNIYSENEFFEKFGLFLN